MNNLKVNATKRILIALSISTILLIATSTGVGAISTATTADHCGSKPHQGGASLPKCCLISEYPLSHCVVTNTADFKVLYTNKKVSNGFNIAWYKTNTTTETSPNPKKFIQLEPTQALPLYYYPQYHCRNCLNSEEPPLD